MGKDIFVITTFGRSNGQSYKLIATNNKMNAVKTCGTNKRTEYIKFDETTPIGFTQLTMYTVVLSLNNQSMLLKLVLAKDMLVGTLVTLPLTQCHQ